MNARHLHRKVIGTYNLGTFTVTHNTPGTYGCIDTVSFFDDEIGV